jgi:hypothetical protein
VWIVLVARGDVSDSGHVRNSNDNGFQFDVVRLAALLI